MKTKKKNGFKIIQSGMATQIVLLCHGGWNDGDGFTSIPAGVRLCFYTGHGHFTIGMSVYDAVCKEPARARGGLVKKLDIAEDDLRDMAKAYNTSFETLRDRQLAQTTGVYDSFEGPNPIFDYVLSREPNGTRYENEKKTTAAHARGAQNVDIDLMVMTTTKPRALSDVFSIIKDMGYQTLHFGACRVPYGGTPSDVTG
ncbi:hypothetical protein JQV27_13010 [Sulfitobacter mediterraneus]|uniref:putative adhesin n=1 Tax=Sulfitobacter TaxID=60136 RepID=UPI001934B593|nr:MULTISPECIES: hypothetical protein [Sulfitobacter]MBM1633931.1 hypothetical protein [Sulfitobacter mediterraneus]MBM1641554.1 hypothetical protein [Sulfitobacter mediterraneus]MBM1645795.1 hypothetical protein [Sulfitobacter mediterraneus]MBM1649673.1 hypothetical protein [Sulfitobacter mediterraneus]MBM1653864.1 hypothetical protein [Sulfitobacter mediterraneus]